MVVAGATSASLALALSFLSPGAPPQQHMLAGATPTATVQSVEVERLQPPWESKVARRFRGTTTTGTAAATSVPAASGSFLNSLQGVYDRTPTIGKTVTRMRAGPLRMSAEGDVHASMPAFNYIGPLRNMSPLDDEESAQSALGNSLTSAELKKRNLKQISRNFELAKNMAANSKARGRAGDVSMSLEEDGDGEQDASEETKDTFDDSDEGLLGLIFGPVWDPDTDSLSTRGALTPEEYNAKNREIIERTEKMAGSINSAMKKKSRLSGDVAMSLKNNKNNDEREILSPGSVYDAIFGDLFSEEDLKAMGIDGEERPRSFSPEQVNLWNKHQVAKIQQQIQSAAELRARKDGDADDSTEASSSSKGSTGGRGGNPTMRLEDVEGPKMSLSAANIPTELSALDLFDSLFREPVKTKEGSLKAVGGSTANAPTAHVPLKAVGGSTTNAPTKRVHFDQVRGSWRPVVSDEGGEAGEGEKKTGHRSSDV